MKKLHTSLLISLISFPLLACQPSEPQIDRADVERIITTLSADEMQGRRTFTPGIEKAAQFIQDEFEKIGLETLEGLDSYAQAFHVYSLSPESRNVVLNGQEIPGDRYFTSVNREALSWTTEDAVDVHTVGPQDDLRDVFSSLRQSRSDALVLVDESHADLFNRFRSFFSGASRTMDLGRGGNAVYILTADREARTYAVEVKNNVTERGLANVAGQITGHRTDEIVLFSAHYDHIGIRPAVEGDSIANGANDDASGTTAVIALANYFKQQGQPERTLLFVAFTAEEMGGYGSQYFSRQLDPEQIVAMFNIEMIGKPATEGPNTAWITGFERSDFGEILQRAVEGTPFAFYPDPYPDQNLFYRSDNATLARLGVPAHSISTTPIDVDPDYHQVSDEVETLDLEHMTNTILAISQGAATIVSGQATPTRVDVSQVR
ncbi:MAG: M20/M25/M40 family metallo-hydrolase [Rhodothermales bacterium]